MGRATGGPLHEKDVVFVLSATATITKRWGLFVDDNTGGVAGALS